MMRCVVIEDEKDSVIKDMPHIQRRPCDEKEGYLFDIVLIKRNQEYDVWHFNLEEAEDLARIIRKRIREVKREQTTVKENK